MKIRRAIVFCLIFVCIQTTTARKCAEEKGPIFIRADGTVEPAVAPIQRNGDVYTLMNNITSETDGIVIEKSSITFDGSGHTVQGGTNGSGFYLYSISNVTISNTRTVGFKYGIYLESTSRNVVSGNDITRCIYDGISLSDAANNTISSNNINKNGWAGIGLYFSLGNNITENRISDNYYGIISLSSQKNSIFHNNFVANTDQISSDGLPTAWDNGYPSGGNYWSDHNPADGDLDRIGDLAYITDENNFDQYPLVYPYGFVPKPDVNSDGTVNIIDIATVATAFACEPGDDRWNPLTDLDMNEMINIIDIADVARNFG